MQIAIWRSPLRKFYIIPHRLTLKINPHIYTWLGLLISFE